MNQLRMVKKRKIVGWTEMSLQSWSRELLNFEEIWEKLGLVNKDRNKKIQIKVFNNFFY